MWTKAGWMGGAAAAQIGASPYAIPPHVARVWCLRPVGSSDECRLPDARKLQRGWSLFLIFNDSGSLTLDVADSEGTVLGTVGAPGFAEVGLVDNSTAAGEWVLRLGTPPSGSFSGYDPSQYVAAFGGSGSSLKEYALYAIELDSWAIANHPSADLNAASACLAADKAYIRRSTAMYEYVYDSFTTKTAAATAQGAPQGMAGINGKAICYERGLNFVKEFTPGSNSWAALGYFVSAGNQDEVIENYVVAQDDADPIDEAYILAGVGSDEEAELYRHDRSGDTYTLLGQPTYPNIDGPCLFAINRDRVHMAGGAAVSGYPRAYHQSYESATDSGWTQMTELPTARRYGGGVQSPMEQSRANVGMGTWAGDGDHWEWDHLTETWRALADPTTSHPDQENSWTTCPVA